MPVSFGLYKNFRASEFIDPGVIFGDYFVFTYDITDGSDLDIRFGFLNVDVPGYLGWGANERLTANGIDIAFWAGDNTGLGTEMVYVDKAAFFQAFPSETDISVDLRAFWYGSSGANPVILGMDAYQGGAMVKSTTYPEFTNPTATNSFPAARSFINYISLQTENAETQGQRVARATIDFTAQRVDYSAN